MTITFKFEQDLKDYDAVSLAEILRAYFVEHFPLKDVQRLNDAIQVASYLHRDDVRRGARGKSVKPPYIEHPLRVAIRLFRYFDVKDADIIIAAILHDTVEDHPNDFADFEGVKRVGMLEILEARVRALDFIAEHFGRHVANIVSLVSNPLIGTQTKEEKIATYQKHVTQVVNFSSDALIVKVSDFVDNAGSLHHHYDYGDPKVQYFIDRYEALIPIYRAALDHFENPPFNQDKAVSRLDQVSDQFNLFRA